MKIVIDARMYQKSGIGRYLSYILDALKNRAAAEIVLLGDSEALAEYAALDHISVIHYKRRIYDPREHWELARLIPECDVYFSPHFITPLIKIKAKKRVTTIHDVFHLGEYGNYGLISTLYIRFLVRNALRKSDHIFTDSEFSKNEIMEYSGIHNKDIEVVHLDVDRKVFRSLEKDDQSLNSVLQLLQSEKYFLAVGNIKPHKNLSRLISAFNELDDKNAYLVIVGESKGFITLDASFEKLLQSCPRLIFSGRLDDDELVTTYNRARALIFPTLYEGFGFPPLEAMACATPCLVSDIPVVREVCGDAALYFDPLDIGSITRCMKDFLDREQDITRALVQKGRIRLKQFSMDRFIDAHLKIILSDD